MKNDFLGSTYISLKRAFQEKNTWISFLGQKLGDRENINKNVPITGAISFHLKYVPEGEINDNTNPQLEEIPKIDIIIEKAVQLQDLDGFGKGKSDPFVLFSLENY